MTGLMQFVANDIRLEGMAVDVALDSTWIDGHLRDAGVRARRTGGEGGRVVGRLSRSNNDIVVRCQVRAQVEADCVRCLAPSPFDVRAEISLLLHPVPKAAPSKSGSHRGKGPRAAEAQDEYEFDAGEADIDQYDGETVRLDPFVREAILLEMPSFPLCSEACPGIRRNPESGVQPVEPAAVDPRLAPLGALRKQLGGPATLDEVVAAAAEQKAALGRPVLRSNTHRAKKKKK